MKRTGLRVILIFTMIFIYVATLAAPVHANDDWQQKVVPSYTEESSTVMGFTTDNSGNIYVVYSVNDPTGEILPFPMAKMYDGSAWTALGEGFLAEVRGGQCKVRFDEAQGRLYVGLITINGVIHIYEYNDAGWEELPSPGRLTRIDPAFIYYDFQVMKDGSLVAAFVDLLEESSITAKVYRQGTWLTLGEPGFTMDPASSISLAVDENNQLIYAGVAIERSQVEVWQYAEDSGWELTDSSAIESIYPYWVKMAIGNGDRPILIYMDAEQEWKTIGMYYGKGIWYYMEPHPFSPAINRTFGMVMDSDGWPIVFVNDSEYENKISSMKYNGEMWEYIGRRGFTSEGAHLVFAGLDDKGAPFVLLPDASNEGQLFRMEYGEVEPMITDTDADEAVEQTDSEPEDTVVAPQPEPIAEESTSESGFGLTIPIVAGVFVVVVLIFLMTRKKRENDEE